MAMGIELGVHLLDQPAIQIAHGSGPHDPDSVRDADPVSTRLCGGSTYSEEIVVLGSRCVFSCEPDLETMTPCIRYDIHNPPHGFFLIQMKLVVKVRI